MLNEDDIKKIRKALEELLQKMTITVFDMEIKISSVQKEGFSENKDCVDVGITIEDPQVLIGHNGQTLFEFGRLVRILLNKKLSRDGASDKILPKDFYVNLDINEYKKKKIEYLKDLAEDMASQVLKTKENKVLPPMPNYERKIIHSHLAQRTDVITESQGEGEERCVIIKLR